ncbi:MAG: integrase core domain-containing protein [Chloroflexi bacterium]|nr:integrase core domain-containing protein [Chloroflexota bacterium]
MIEAWTQNRLERRMQAREHVTQTVRLTHTVGGKVVVIARQHAQLCDQLIRDLEPAQVGATGAINPSGVVRPHNGTPQVRIQGELRTLGFDISAETVRRYRLRALRRPPTRRWREFLHNHRHEIWVADFFTVPTLTLSTLYVFFVISHDRRRIEHFNRTRHPTADWVWRQLMEATPWGVGPRFLIRDRDRNYGGDFVARARRIGIETVLTPVRAPQANAVAERVIGTLRRECVDHIIPLSEQHLRAVLREYGDYYNATRPHRTLELEPPAGPRPVQAHGRVVAHPILGGLHHRYEREAA